MTGHALKQLVASRKHIPLKDFPLTVTDAIVTVYLYSRGQAACVLENQRMPRVDNSGRERFGFSNLSPTLPKSPKGLTYSEMFTAKAGAPLRSTSNWNDFIVVEVTTESAFVPCPTCKGYSIRGGIHACSTCQGHSSISRELYERVYAPK